jgi:hypothetical protein
MAAYSKVVIVRRERRRMIHTGAHSPAVHSVMNAWNVVSVALSERRVTIRRGCC